MKQEAAINLKGAPVSVSPKVKMVQLSHKLRILSGGSEVTLDDYQALRIAVAEEIIMLQECANELTTGQKIYLEMVMGIHANLVGVTHGVSESVQRRLYDASIEADWHMSFLEKNGGLD